MGEEKQEVVIVGAGIAGLATALGLKRVGIRSLVLERSSELRATGAAITLMPNAWGALDALGVANKLTSIYPLLERYLTILESGATQELPFSKFVRNSEMGVRAVLRKTLLETLAEELPPGTIRYSSKLVSIKYQVSEDSTTVTILHLEDGTVIRAKVLIGCDGLHSVVAQWLGLSAPFDSSRWAVRGLALYPEGHGFQKEVRQFLVPGKRAGMAPVSDHEIYWFITQANSKGGEYREMARDPELILKEMTQNLAKDLPPEFLEVARHAEVSTVSWAPLMLRAPWDLILKQAHRGSVTVAGDAMHPMTPELGQGGCSALEDAVFLARNLGNALVPEGLDTKRAEAAIQTYVKERRWRVVGLIVVSYMSGFVQLGGQGILGWAVKLFRDHVFYRFVFPRIGGAVHFDCGVLTKAE